VEHDDYFSLNKYCSIENPGRNRYSNIWLGLKFLEKIFKKLHTNALL